MKMKRYLKIKSKERKYLKAVHTEAKAYLNVLESADNILKFGNWCFDSYPVMTNKCQLFREDCKCAKTHCPLNPFNDEFIDALRAREVAHRNVNRAQTAVLAAKVRE